MFSLDEIFSLLTESVPEHNASKLFEKCKEIGMREIEYINTGLDSNLPEFDKGYNFVFQINDNVETKLEILEKDFIIMQAGIQSIYSPSIFSSKAKKHFNILKNKSDKYYGEGSPMNMGGVEILNYGNIYSVCYLSKMKSKGRDVINFKVGNRKFW